MSTNVVRLRCVRERNGRIRVRIVSPGYSSEANCQFPRDIRVVDTEYEVPAEDVSFSEMRCKFFYRIKPNRIRIVESSQPSQTNPSRTIHSDLVIYTIYGDAQECCICFAERDPQNDSQFVIFSPCGHYCCCNDCATKINKCPMCRAAIRQTVTKAQLGL